MFGSLRRVTDRMLAALRRGRPDGRSGGERRVGDRLPMGEASLLEICAGLTAATVLPAALVHVNTLLPQQVLAEPTREKTRSKQG